MITASDPRLWARIAGWVGIAAHVCILFFYVTSGLVAPAWAVAGLLVLWLVLLVVAIRLLRARPALALLVPVAAALIWFAVIASGGAWLGWTA